MNGKARLTELATRISEKRKDVNPTILNTEKLEANPSHGAKGDFVKVTITMPPAVYELIAKEAARRKMAKERDPNISAIVREASVKYLEGNGTKA
ncbi:MAG: hypothetical protein M3R15_29575 [Acidobacteriota bacterium]|nr:hypothetical protein [Acidobacteriota bacterium]